ncbi:hypothetical protein F2Q70_00025838 [Brassica cretica]|uniref:Uncharacterized protein n=1 Tax=Brassica cretica TaxID=69181 RepID=A0A8S9L7V9_BRACR|nr:hypothetical protein F2Q70_00025838 [Brassica cretica]
MVLARLTGGDGRGLPSATAEHGGGDPEAAIGGPEAASGGPAAEHTDTEVEDGGGDDFRLWRVEDTRSDDEFYGGACGFIRTPIEA